MLAMRSITCSDVVPFFPLRCWLFYNDSQTLPTLIGQYQGALYAEKARASCRGRATYDIPAAFAQAIAFGERSLALFTHAVGEVHL